MSDNVLFFSAIQTVDELKEENDDSKKDLDYNTSEIFNSEQLLNLLRCTSNLSNVTVGFLGYPNVGKSSSINCFLTGKKLPVSATPGKTKHYQTHVLSDDLTLVDGPGLVIPNLKMSKADMVLAGILPIDNLTDYLPSIELLLTKVSFGQIRKHYGIVRSCVIQAKSGYRKNESLQILSALALMRGFMKPGGVPDDFKAAKLILKDFVMGKLVYCKAPPQILQSDYFCTDEIEEDFGEEELSIAESFPEMRVNAGVHVRGAVNMPGGLAYNKKHGNKKKREKARRRFDKQ